MKQVFGVLVALAIGWGPCAPAQELFPLQMISGGGGGINVATVVVDPAPPNVLSNGYLEKTIGNFTSAADPSIIIVESLCGSVQLYQNSGPLSGSWSRSQLNVGDLANPPGPFGGGYCYERAKPIRFAGNSFDNLVLSTGSTVSILMNPANSGQDPTTTQWPRTVILNRGAHDIKVVDIDGDGKLDIVGSASSTLGASPNFIAYQNSPTSWQVVNGPLAPGGASMGDGIAVTNIQGSPAVIGVSTSDNNLYWAVYPGSRTGAWTPHVITSADTGVSLTGSTFTNGAPYVAMAENELMGNGGGLRVFAPPADPTQPWNQTTVDGSFQAVHEINLGSWNGFDYLITGEQGQACSGSGGFHGPPCRITMFHTTNDGASWDATPLDTRDIQNQQTIQFGSDLLVVGMGFNTPDLSLWVISP